MSQIFESTKKSAERRAGFGISPDPEFVGIPHPSEEEAALDIQKRIEELREFIQSQ